MTHKKTKKIALYGVLVAVALILSYVESLIPAFYAVPGMKLGLTNVVVVFALYFLGNKSAMAINLIRILLVSLLFGNFMGLAYSLVGGMLSTIVMILLKRTGKFKIVTVSIVGGVVHNLGQVLVAVVLLQTTSLAYYFLILWFAGIAAGFVIGIISALLVKRLQKIIVV